MNICFSPKPTLFSCNASVLQLKIKCTSQLIGPDHILQFLKCHTNVWGYNASKKQWWGRTNKVVIQLSVTTHDYLPYDVIVIEFPIGLSLDCQPISQLVKQWIENEENICV